MGSVTGGQVAPQSRLGGCQYNSSQPTLTTTNQVAVQCDVNGNLRISGTVTATTGLVAVTPTDKSGTLTAGGTSQILAVANPSRKSLIVQNPCTATGENIAAIEDVYINVTGSATVAGASNFVDLPPCSSAEISYNGTVITTSVTVNAATINHRWYATEAQ